jgi:hypothetical protein
MNARTQMFFADILHKNHARRHGKNARKKRFNRIIFLNVNDGWW